MKLIRDKIKGTPVGYGFVEFQTHDVAKNVYMTLNNSPIPGTSRVFKLNWATHGHGGSKPINAPIVGGPLNRPMPAGPELSKMPSQDAPQQEFQLYVGDLDPNVND